MKLRYYGHNCFVIEAAHVKILTDPWFRPAYHTWYPYPINRRFRPDLLANQRDLDYLYISHPHLDHFDEIFLAELRKDIKIICPSFPNKTMQKKYRKLGFYNLIESESKILADGLRFQVLQDASPLREDSALYVQETTNGEMTSFLNLNDCYIDYARLPKGVTYLASQFSAAIYYPHVYDFPHNVKAKKILEMQNTTWNHCLETIKRVNPSFYIPSSGPPRFLDPELAPLNNSQTSIFYDFDYVRDDFHRETDISVLDLAPGDTYTEGKFTDGARCEDRDIESWSKRLKSEWSSFSSRKTEYSDTDLEAFFSDIKNKNQEFIERFPRRFRLIVPTSEGSKEYVISLDPSSDYLFSPSPEIESFNYTFTLPPQLICNILYDGWDWAEACVSLKAILHRDEDYYDQALFQILTFGQWPETLKVILRGLEENNEMIQKGRFLVQRLCPHAGHDLRYAILDDNVLTCPRHRWQWDLSTGRCLRGGNTPIKSKVAEEV